MKIKDLRKYSPTLQKVFRYLNNHDELTDRQLAALSEEVRVLNETISAAQPTEWLIVQHKTKRNLLKPRQRFYYTVENVNGQVTLVGENMHKEAMISGSENLHKYLERSEIIKLY